MRLEDGAQSGSSAPGSILVEASVELEETQVGGKVVVDGTGSAGTVLAPALVGFALDLDQFKLAHTRCPLS
jgi:hypothetical protein